jgi:hypothetical protein
LHAFYYARGYIPRSAINHVGSYRQSAQVFGTSKTRAYIYIDEVFRVLKLYKFETIRLPQTEAQWREVADDFEQVAGFPYVAGAIDGSFIPIHRYYSVMTLDLNCMPDGACLVMHNWLVDLMSSADLEQGWELDEGEEDGGNDVRRLTLDCHFDGRFIGRDIHGFK